MASPSARPLLGGAAELGAGLPQPAQVGWLRQLGVVARKDALLLWRRPALLVAALLGCAVSVLLAWAVGPDVPLAALPKPLNPCGVVDAYLMWGGNWSYDSPGTLNGAWANGVALALLSLGPLVQGLAAFLAVHHEIQHRLLGVQRALGMRESVYWCAWLLVFACTSLASALLGSLVALAVPVHVLQNVYFGGVLGSLFFLQLALVGASFFLAALCGTAGNKGAAWLIFFIILAPWIIILIGPLQGDNSAVAGQSPWTPAGGAFWSLRQTTMNYGPRSSTPLCTSPVVAAQFFDTLLSPAEAAVQITPASYFQGCYAAPGGLQVAWNYGSAGGGVAATALFLVPYYHFFLLWGSFLGLTALPGSPVFSQQHMSLSPEELVPLSLPLPGGAAAAAAFGAINTTGFMFPQLSTFMSSRSNTWDYSGANNNCPVLPNGSLPLCNPGNPCRAETPRAPTASPSGFALLGTMFALCVIYTMLGAWWSMVFPHGNGAARAPYFFLMPRYWLPTRRGPGAGASNTTAAGAGVDIIGSPSASTAAADPAHGPGLHVASAASDPDDRASGTRLARRASESGGGALSVHRLRKQYGTLEALRGVSLRVGRGELIALLGHNGAGKSTLSNLLACEQLPTSGEAFVFGRSVVDEPDLVRELVGVCAQDDVLWPSLSPKEHLELFAGLRGVAPAVQPAVVARWLESVELADVRDQQSRTFSGGMKRRLSLALATVGDRPLLILDEISTGMDPVNRRTVWRHIEEVKAGRVVVLTTHAMEEADLLADTVAILRAGEIAALGTPLQLKAQYGSALQFSLLAERAATETVVASIQERFFRPPLATVRAGNSGDIEVSIHKVGSAEEQGVSPELLGEFVAWLEDSAQSQVIEYGFSNSSLEEVFLKVTEGDKPPGEAHADDQVQVCCECCGVGCVRCCLAGGCRCCCCPRQRQHQRTHDDEHLEEPRQDDKQRQQLALDGAESVAVPVAAPVGPEAPGGASREYATLAAFKPDLRIAPQLEALLLHRFSASWAGVPSIVNYIMFTLLAAAPIIAGFYVSASGASVYAGLFPALVLSLMLPSLVAVTYQDRSLGLFHLMRTQGMLGRSFVLAETMYSFAVQLVFGIVVVSLFFASPLWRTSTSWCLGPGTWAPCAGGSWGLTPISYYNTDGSVEVYAITAPGGWGLLFALAVFFALSLPGTVLACSFMPGNKRMLVLLTVFALVAGAGGIVFIAAPWASKPQSPYLQPSIAACMSGSTSYSANNLSAAFVDCAAVQASSSFYIMSLPPAMALLPQFGVYLGTGVALNYNVQLVTNPKSYLTQVLLPAMPADAGCDASGLCTSAASKQRFGQVLGWMLLGALAWAAFGALVVALFVFPSKRVLTFKASVARMLAPVLHPRKTFRARRAHRDERSASQEQPQAGGAADGKELEEVTKERELVEGLLRPYLVAPGGDNSGDDAEEDPTFADLAALPRETLPPVLLHRLSKTYPAVGGLPPKVALDRLDLHVPHGQVLGLLGKNGAGKTTALKILSATHDASSGLALVGGHDVATERIEVFERLGNCPQFDVVWPSRTVAEHLEFFVRLKGIERAAIRATARAIAVAVGLGAPEVYGRSAGRLSGGMRRRLSIAISLIGAPTTLLLDEPSTGLDPATRSNIWSLISAFATPQRAVVITTHAMLEADALCSRIAIMAKGRLKVVATQQRLKDRFGSGFLLQVNLIKNHKQDEEAAIDFVRRRVHQDAKIAVRQARTLRINLPRDADLRTMFSALYSAEAATEGRISQFLLSQSSLEDVFIAVGE